MSLLPPTTLETQPTLWSASGGQMGRRIQEHDWSQHPLGPLEDWPLSLRTTLQVMLNSRFDMWMGWGPELYFFCNDAYIPTLGLKADRALGLPAGELWAEVWDHAGPRAESVLQTGKATWDDRLLLFLERNGYPEETYHTFSYSPVPDDAGGIGGMLCVVTEETERVVGERRLGVLRDLAERLTPASAEQSWFQTLEAGLSQCTLDLPLVLVYLAEEDGRTARLKSATGIEPGTQLSPLQLELESTHQFWPVGNTALGGCNVDVLDLGAHASLTREGPWGRPTHAVLLPLQQMGQDDDTAGFLVVGLNPRRPLDAAYRGFLELFAASVCAGIAQTRALEAGRRQAQSLAELNEVRRESALQLERSEERTRLAVDAGKVGIWDWDLVAERVVWSDQSYAIFNIPPTAFDGTFNGFLAIVHPDDRDQVRLAVQRSHAGNGEYEVELRILRPDGSEAWLSTHGKTTFDAGGRPVRMHGTVVDVTERKQSEELLRVTRQRLESTLYAAEIGTWNWDIRRDVVVADENMSRLYFVGSAGKAGLPIQRFLQVIHPDDLPAVGQAITNALSLPDGSFEEDYRLVAPDGQIRWVTARGRVIRDAQGEPEHFPGVIIDISARKRAEQALSESEQRHRKLLSLLPVPCYTLDEDGWLTFYNGAARDLWGRAPELGRVRWCGSYKLWSLDGAFIPPDRCPTATALRESKVIRGAELMAERPDGSRRWLSLSSHPLFDARGRCTGVINVAIDVTDERRTQKALEENEAFLQSVISSTADSLMIMDHGGRLQWTSE
ncbi:MAG TPA: PAS domain-containing protein, partial [Verrucomicrobium sp.]|nr:PAS domain-containing protein [Verrucomicrobium sp.]